MTAGQLLLQSQQSTTWLALAAVLAHAAAAPLRWLNSPSPRPAPLRPAAAASAFGPAPFGSVQWPPLPKRHAPIAIPGFRYRENPPPQALRCVRQACIVQSWPPHGSTKPSAPPWFATLRRAQSPSTRQSVAVHRHFAGNGPATKSPASERRLQRPPTPLGPLQSPRLPRFRAPAARVHTPVQSCAPGPLLCAIHPPWSR